jgi:hypothetical protein
LVARLGAHLLTGAGFGVMAAAAEGFVGTEQRAGFSIGIVPRHPAGPLERTVELGHRWYGPELLADLGALSVAEHRAHRRRLQLACTEGWAAPSEPP